MCGKRALFLLAAVGLSWAVPPQAFAKDPQAGGLRPDDLRCEYLINPPGIDDLHPRLSWKLTPTDQNWRGQRQLAYQVLVASERSFLDQDRGDLWDSGKVQSDRSIHVEYGGRPLSSRMPCWWKVRVWDQNGRPSDWSQPAFWSMGLLDPDDWNNAQWIGLDRSDDEGIEITDVKAANWLWFPEERS